MILDLVPRGIDRHWKLRDVALELGYFARALLVDFINANDRVHGQIGSFDILELGFDFFFRRINDDTRPLAEDKLFYFDKSEHFAMANLAGVDLVDLSLAHENDAIEVFLAHADIDSNVLGAAGRVVYAKIPIVGIGHIWSCTSISQGHKNS